MRSKMKFRVLYQDDASKEFKVASFTTYEAANKWCIDHSRIFEAFIIEYMCVLNSVNKKKFYSKEVAQHYAKINGWEVLPVISMELPAPALKILSSDAV